MHKSFVSSDVWAKVQTHTSAEPCLRDRSMRKALALDAASKCSFLISSACPEWLLCFNMLINPTGMLGVIYWALVNISLIKLTALLHAEL